MRRYISILILSSILSSCMSVGQIQGECEQIYTKFKDIYNCSKPKLLDAFEYHAQFQRVKLYLLEGEVLSEKVDKGEISDTEAKAKWQKLYIDLGTTGRDSPN